MSKSTEQRVKDKLKMLSKQNQIPFNSLLDNLFLERFLVRIASSKYKKNLIFKGGMCLSKIIDLNRATKDIDFLMREQPANIEHIESIMNEISQINVGDDFVFFKTDVDQLSIEHKKYPGYRISIAGNLGQIRHKISIDIGIGDVVRPKMLEIELLNSNGPLFEDKVTLPAYPPEYIFSEKYEAILYLGELNSRMKDFYDCYNLILSGTLDKTALRTAMAETLDNRNTQYKAIPSPGARLVLNWKGFVKKNNVKGLELEHVVNKVNSFLLGLNL